MTPGAARRRIHVPPSRNAYPPSRRPRAAPGGRSALDTRFAKPERVPAFSSAAGCARGPLGAGYTFRRAGTRTRLLVGRGLRPGAARRRIHVPQSRNAYPPSRRPRAAPGGRSAPDTRSAEPERAPAFSSAAGCARGPLGAGYTFRKAGTRTRLLVGRGLRPGAARRRIHVPPSRNAHPPSRRPRAAPGGRSAPNTVSPSRNAYPPSRRPRAAPGGRSAPDTRSAEPERASAFSSAAGCARRVPWAASSCFRRVGQGPPDPPCRGSRLCWTTGRRPRGVRQRRVRQASTLLTKTAPPLGAPRQSESALTTCSASPSGNTSRGT